MAHYLSLDGGYDSQSNLQSLLTTPPEIRRVIIRHNTIIARSVSQQLGFPLAAKISIVKTQLRVEMLLILSYFTILVRLQLFFARGGGVIQLA